MALAYWASSQAALMIAVPRGCVTAVWPAAGIALAAVVQFGTGVLPGVWLGAFLIDLQVAWKLGGAPIPLTMIAVASLVATGATLQAAIGAALLRRFAGAPKGMDLATDRLGNVLVFGALSALFNPTFSSAVFWVAGVTGRIGIFVPWSIWFTGDCIGVLLFCPLLLYGFNRGWQWQRLRLVVIPTVVMAAAFGLVFMYLKQREASYIRHQFRQIAEEKSRSLIEQVRDDFGTVRVLGNLFATADNAPAIVFQRYASRLLSRDRQIQAVQWMPRHAKMSSASESTSQTTTASPVDQQGSEGRWAPAVGLAEHFPVTLVEPRREYEAEIGFDAASDPLRRAALDRAGTSGEIAITAPLQLKGRLDAGQQVLAVQSVIAEPRGDPSSALLGFVGIAFRINEVIAVALDDVAQRNFLLRLTDEPSEGGRSTLFADAAFTDTALRLPSSAPRWQTTFLIGGRRWRIEMIPTGAFFPRFERPLTTWGIFAMGLLLTALVQAFLMTTADRTDQVERQVAMRTDELSRANAALSSEIEERKRAELELAKSEDRYRAVVQDQTEAIARFTPDGLLTFVNDVACRMAGSTQQLLLGNPWYQFTHPEDLPSVLEKLQSLCPTNPVVVIENRLVAPNGEPRWLQFVNRGFFNEEGQLVEIQSVGRDIADRKLAELHLAEREQQWDALIDNIPLMVFVKDARDLRYVHMNKEGERITGAKTADVVGHTDFDFFPRRKAEYQTQCDRQVLDTGEMLDIPEDRMSTPRGVRTFHTRKVGVLGADGQPRFLLGISIDITERKQAEEQLRRSKERLQLALRGANDGLWEWDVQTGKSYYSPRWKSMLGYTEDELPDTPDTFLLLIHSQDLPAALKTLQDTIQAGSESFELEFRMLHKHGHWVDILSRGFQALDANGEVVRMIGTHTDITRRKRAEEALRRSHKLEALGTMAGGIAHDFNNILLSITGNAKLALEDLALDHPAHTSLVEISKAGNRAAELVRQILAFSRPQEKKHEALQLPPVVEDAVKLVRSTLPAMIDVRADLGAGVPMIAANATEIHQVLVNLAINAAHAIGPQGGRIEVRLDAVEVTREMARVTPDLHPGSYARLSVSDTGCGMDAATVARIFDPFFTTKATGEGTGLGLSIVHGIVTGNDGVITVESEPGRGSTFRLYFPAIEPGHQSPPKPAQQAASGQGRHVLYVDDDEALVFLISRLLERLGYRVTACNAPTQALREFQQRPDEFDAVVTDLSMPEMSGFELARRMLQLRPTIPIVMTSGYVRVEEEELASQIGIRALILKPDTADDLSHTLHRVFQEDGARSS
ncbi:MAG: PAS domain S-box protein [Deltaproteobacteria bacterium]|nr:PAS domain S-box protein [Deltaproteobacteria bacterium]